MYAVVESPTMCQNLWKKIGWKPSGPGALYGLKDLKAAAISCFDTSSLRVALISSEKNTEFGVGEGCRAEVAHSVEYKLTK